MEGGGRGCLQEGGVLESPWSLAAPEPGDKQAGSHLNVQAINVVKESSCAASFQSRTAPFVDSSNDISFPGLAAPPLVNQRVDGCSGWLQDCLMSCKPGRNNKYDQCTQSCECSSVQQKKKSDLCVCLTALEGFLLLQGHLNSIQPSPTLPPIKKNSRPILHQHLRPPGCVMVL